MTLKKTAKSKRTNLPRDSGRSKQFIKDWEDLSCSGRYDIVIQKSSVRPAHAYA